MELEPRIAFDAAMAETFVDVANDTSSVDTFENIVSNQEPSSENENNSANFVTETDNYVESTAETRTEIVFIDASVDDVETLISGVSQTAEIVLISGDVDGVEFISNTLEGRSDVDAVHIISHGTPGSLQLGSSILEANSINADYRDELTAIGSVLNSDADLLIYGCDFGAGTDGSYAVALLAEITGADVAASDDDTGHLSLSADWDLEVTSGSIETTIAIASAAQQEWQHTLDPEVVDNLQDFENTETLNTRAVELVTLSNGNLIMITSERGGADDGISTYRIDNTPGSPTYGQIIGTNPANGGAGDDAARIDTVLASTAGNGYNSIEDLVAVTLSNGNTYVYSADPTAASIGVTQINADGTMTVLSGVTLAGFMDVPQEVSIHYRGTQPYLSVLADDSLHIFSIATNGALTAEDYVDSGTSASLNNSTDPTFDSIMESFTNSSGENFVIAGGISDQLSLWTVDGSDQLVLQDTRLDDTTEGGDLITPPQLGLTDTDGASFAEIGGNTYVFVGGLENSISMFRVDGSGPYNLTLVGHHEAAVTARISTIQHYNVNGVDYLMVGGEQGGLDRFQINIDGGGVVTLSALSRLADAADPGAELLDSESIAIEGDIMASASDDDWGVALINLDHNNVATGIPTISGTLTENQLLTAQTSGIADLDGLGAFSYQWYRDTGSGPVAISGATASTYVLDDADVGANISVAVSFTDGDGYSEGPLTSSPTAAIANVNDAPTGVPTISGTLQEDQTLTASTSGIADADGLGAFSYQWYRDTGSGPVAISGATASTYTLGDADVGANISVAVSYTDGQGTSEGPLTSSPTAAIANVNDVPTGVPTISGTLQEDQTLTASTSGIADADGLGAFSYQWYRDTGSGPVAISGATASTYTLGDADVGANISVAVSYTDGQGTSEGPLTSSPTAAIANVNDAPTGISSGIELNTDGGNDVYLYTPTMATSLTQTTIEISFSGVANTGLDNALFSYAIAGNHNEILIEITSTGAVKFMPSGHFTQSAPVAGIFDGNMHHLSFTWDSAGGEVRMYFDGALFHSVSGLGTGATIDSGGAIVLGQDQDSVLGDFESSESLSGTLHDVRIWDHVRTASEIVDFNNRLIDASQLPAGLVHNWQMSGFNGSNQVVDIVSGNNLSVGHATGTGYTASNAILDLHIAENSANGTSVGYVQTTDPDANENFTYVLTDSASGRFAINATTGEITVANGSLLNFETATSHNITIRVTDSGGLTYDQVFTVAVDDANDPPVATGNSLATNEDTPLVFSASDFLFSDEDGNPLQSITITLLNLAGGTLTHTGGTVTVTNGMTVTASQIADLTFTPALNSTTSASFNYTVNDADSGVVAATMNISVNAINDVPVATGNTVVTSEDTPLIIGPSDFLFTDVEGNPLQSIIVSNLNLAGGTLTHTAGSVTVTNGMTIDVAQLADLTFTPALNSVTTASFDYTVNDAGLGVVAATMNINVNAINDAPVNSMPGTQSTDVDTNLTLSSATFNVIQITDVDAGASSVSVTLTATNGVMTLSTTAGLSFSVGDGSADTSMQFSGTIASINAALDGMVYIPNGGYSGNATITVQTSDQGNTGIGGPLLDSDILHIDVGGSRFQEGVSGYSGTEDTYVIDNNPNTSFGSASVVHSEDIYPDAEGLLLFNDLFGNGAGQIPPYSNINMATVSIYVTTTDPHDTVEVHEMLSPWSESSTYNSLGGGVQADGVEASVSTFSIIDAGQSGWVNISLPLAMVQAWADGGSNYGLAFLTGDADCWAFASSEHPTVEIRPYITIDYTAPVAPTITSNGGGSIASVNVLEGQTAVTTVTSSDPDGGTPTYSIIGGADAGHFTINPVGGGLSFITPPDHEAPTDVGANNTYEVIVQVDDNQGSTDNQTITVTVQNVNEVPVATGNTVVTNEDTPLLIGAGDFLFTDVEGDALQSVTISNLNLAGGTLTHTGGTVTVTNGITVTLAQLADLTFTPALNSTANVSFDYSVNDAGVGVTTAAMNITVIAVNDAPVATGNTVATNEDTPLVFTVGDFTFSDIEGDALQSATISNLNLGGGTLTHTGGTVTVTNGMTITSAQIADLTFTPALDSNGSFSFDYAVNDADNGAVSATMNITVNAVNDIPVATGNTVVGFEDVPLIIGPSDFLYSDIEGDALQSVTITGLNLAGGTLTHSGGTVAVTNGMTITAAQLADLTYTSALNSSAPASFNYTVNDADNGVVAAAMNISVNAVNDVPVATGNTVVTNEDTPLLIGAGDFLFTDVEGDALQSVTISNLNLAGGTLTHTGGTVTVTNGITVTLAQLADLTFTPALNSTANVSFDYSVNDAGVGVTTAAMNITVIAVNDAPVATGNTVATNEDTPLVFTVGDFTFSDIEGDALQSATISNLNLGGGTLTHTGGTVTVTNGMTITSAQIADLTFTPALDSNGSFSFDYAVNDADNGAVSATMNITVNAVNDAPVITSDGGTATTSLSIDENTTNITQVTSSDVDGGAPVYSIVGGSDQSAFSIAADGTLTFVASPDYETPTDANLDGTYEVIVGVDDGSGGQDTQTIMVVVADVDETSHNSSEPTGSEGEGENEGENESENEGEDGGSEESEEENGSSGSLEVNKSKNSESDGSGASNQSNDGSENSDEGVLGSDDTTLLDDKAGIDDIGEYDIETELLKVPLDLQKKSGAPIVQINLDELNVSKLWKNLNENIKELEESSQVLGIDFNDLTTSAGAALSTGFVAWVLRGSALTSTLIASIPAWQRFDPIVIFVSKDKEYASSEDQTAKSVNQMLDNIKS